VRDETRSGAAEDRTSGFDSDERRWRMRPIALPSELLFFRGADMTVWRFFANVAVVLIALRVYLKFIAR